MNIVWRLANPLDFAHCKITFVGIRAEDLALRHIPNRGLSRCDSSAVPIQTNLKPITRPLTERRRERYEHLFTRCVFERSDGWL